MLSPKLSVLTPAPPNRPPQLPPPESAGVLPPKSAGSAPAGVRQERRRSRRRTRGRRARRPCRRPRRRALAQVEACRRCWERRAAARGRRARRGGCAGPDAARCEHGRRDRRGGDRQTRGGRHSACGLAGMCHRRWLLPPLQARPAPPLVGIADGSQTSDFLSTMAVLLKAGPSSSLILSSSKGDRVI